MQSYDVIAGGAVSKEVQSLLNAVKTGLQSLIDKKALIGYNDSIETVCYVDVLRYCVEIRLENFSNRSLTNIFLSHLSSTENKSAGSGVIFMMAFCEYLQKGLRQKISTGNWDTLEAYKFCGTRSTIDIAKKIMADFCDEGLASLILTACEQIGSEGSLNVSAKHNINRSTVEVDDLYRFDAMPNEVFIQQTGRTQFEIMAPGIITIDGFIESTAEIDRIMRESFETGQPLIIAARGYHQDVANTLAHNYINGKLRILPLEVRYDEVGANSLIDMSKVCQSEFINSLKGDLISTTNMESAGRIERAVIKDGTIGIQVGWDQSSNAYHTINRQRIKLIKKLNETSSDAASSILETRLRSLTPSYCSVTIKTSKGMEGVEKDRASSMIRILKDISTAGFVDLTSLKVHDSYFMGSLLNQLIESGITYVSTSSLNMGIQSAAACAETFLRIGSCLVIDE